ncbi:hypothetical protein [Mucilaginibacter aquatilis]|uniref:Type IX secretion system membrane protein PorP/SprF n=1 Tax=Mucilaginibacter aquatilis TaxID=1517760 RepID=A0A6I4I567_9SPHI|nr:hypothetical protein [Mucilaginibacter aquatilis]MVN90230.1 hypothetical protein [Mucilaginibacter aquatilis]
MKKLYLLTLVAFIMHCSTQYVYAGWPIGKYRHIFTPSLTYYSSKNYWDKNGKKVITPAGTSFNALTIGLYGGVGISRRLDLLASVAYALQSSKFGGITQATPTGFGDATLGFSYNIAAFKYKRFLSVQGTVIAPLYTVERAGNTLGYGVLGGEGKLMYSGEISSKAYFNIEGGYRRYFDDKGPNQILGSITIGTALDDRKKNQLTFDVGGLKSYSNNENLISVNPNLVYNGYYVKGGVSYGHKFTNKFSVFGNAFYTFAGQNAPQGYGGTVFTVFKF